MKRIDGLNYLPNGIGTGKNGWQDYNAATGAPGTVANASTLNSWQEELAGLCEGAGLTLNPADNTQLQQAVAIYIATQMRGMFAPEPTNPASMVVNLTAGYVPGAASVTAVGAQASPAFVAPVGNPRIDLIVISRTTGALSVIAGIPAAIPVAPAIPATAVPVAQIALAPTTTAITAALITDVRDLPPLGLGALAYLGIGANLALDGAGNLTLAGTPVLTGLTVAGSSVVNAVQYQQNAPIIPTASGGTADAITATYSPAIAALSNGMSLLVRAASANATATPTFTPAPGTIAPAIIVKWAGAALAHGDIAGAGHWIELQWDATLTKWTLLNPATGSLLGTMSTQNANAVAITGGTIGPISLPNASSIDANGNVVFNGSTGHTLKINGGGVFANTLMTSNTGGSLTTFGSTASNWAWGGADCIALGAYTTISGRNSAPVTYSYTGFYNDAAGVSRNSSTLGACSMAFGYNALSFAFYAAGAIGAVLGAPTATLGVTAAGLLALAGSLAADAGNTLATFDGAGTTGGNSVRLCAVSVGTNSANGANSALKLGKDGVTGRSQSSAGTNYASGGDYAEYELKRSDCGVIAKGQIVGRDANGQLTDKLALALTFGVKTTNPSYVGSDIWGNEDAVGAVPVEPVYAPPAYTGPAAPTALVAPALSLPAEPVQQAGETDATYAVRIADWQQHCATLQSAYAVAEADYQQQQAIFATADAAYQQGQTAYAATVQQAETAFATAMVNYTTALATYNAALEAARAEVDRIAKCGRVPINLLVSAGGNPGDYVVPVSDGNGGITGQIVAKADLTLSQYISAVAYLRCPYADDNSGRWEVEIKVG